MLTVFIRRFHSPRDHSIHPGTVKINFRLSCNRSYHRKKNRSCLKGWKLKSSNRSYTNWLWSLVALFFLISCGGSCLIEGDQKAHQYFHFLAEKKRVKNRVATAIPLKRRKNNPGSLIGLFPDQSALSGSLFFPSGFVDWRKKVRSNELKFSMKILKNLGTGNAVLKWNLQSDFAWYGKRERSHFSSLGDTFCLNPIIQVPACCTKYT